MSSPVSPIVSSPGSSPSTTSAGSFSSSGGSSTPLTPKTGPAGPTTTRPVTSSGSVSGGPSGQELRNMSKDQQWKSVMLMAEKAGAKYPELVAAQFALESGWGSALSAKNNYFGIKATDSEDATVSNTREVINGQDEYQDARFKNFDTPQDAVNHLVKQWYKDYKGYKGMNNAESAEEAAAELQRQDYATDPTYSKNLQRLLSEYSDVRPSQEERDASLEEKDESIAKGQPPKPGQPGDPGGVEADQQIAGDTEGRYGRIGIPNTDGQDTGADIELFGQRGEIGKTFGDNSKQGPYGNRGVEISFPYDLIYLEKVPGGRNKGHNSIDVQGSTSRDYKAVTGSTGFGHIGSYYYKDPQTGRMFEVMMGHGNKPFKKFKEGEVIKAGTVVGWQGASGSSDSMQGGVYDHVTFHVNAVDGGDPGPIFDMFVDSLVSGKGAQLTAQQREAKEQEAMLAENRPIGSESILAGKPVVWNGESWEAKSAYKPKTSESEGKGGFNPIGDLFSSISKVFSSDQKTASANIAQKEDVAELKGGGIIGRPEIGQRQINTFATYEDPQASSVKVFYQEKIKYIPRPINMDGNAVPSVSVPGGRKYNDNSYNVRRN